MTRPRQPRPDRVPTHLDPAGRLRMVDVGDKPVTRRRAVAEAVVRVSSQLARAIRDNALAKGDLLTVARLAGIQAAKRTSELIPLCHPLLLDHIDVRAQLRRQNVVIRAEVATLGQTGAEMEALTAAAVAALAIVDMGKAVDRGMVIERLRLLQKTGGVHGDYHASRRRRRSSRV